ncbi:MAG: AAA family ATPase [Acutalibacteraceae bacterium]
MEINTVITISREYGSGGRDIGKLVAEKLDIPYYDQEITEIAAKKSGLNNEVLRENDEIATTSILVILWPVPTFLQTKHIMQMN